MDRIIKITVGLFFAILLITIAFAAYTGYVAHAYQSTRVSSFSYTMSITTDSTLTNVTLFIPVPSDKQGNSPIISQFSAQKMPGIPESWQTTLFDTGKATLVKIYIPAIIPAAGATKENPYSLKIMSELPSENSIDTIHPITNSPVFLPITNLRQDVCSGNGAAYGGNPECLTFQTSMYADYTADPNAVITIASSITGKNSWTVFEPQSNEYTSVISLLMHGENHGWATAKGTLVNRIGSF